MSSSLPGRGVARTCSVCAHVLPALGQGQWRVPGTSPQNSEMRSCPRTRTGMNWGLRGQEGGPGCPVEANPKHAKAWPAAAPGVRGYTWHFPPAARRRAPENCQPPRLASPRQRKPTGRPQAARSGKQDAAQVSPDFVFPKRAGALGIGNGRRSRDSNSQEQRQSGRCLPGSNVPGQRPPLWARTSNFGDGAATESIPLYRWPAGALYHRGLSPRHSTPPRGADNPTKGLMPESPRFLQC